ncbi:MAG: hypothetical protein NW226_25670 [Microscillaceae bacterium]|nr:hypothetical protein [Microscillaceae bacterium]
MNPRKILITTLIALNIWVFVFNYNRDFRNRTIEEKKNAIEKYQKKAQMLIRQKESEIKNIHLDEDIREVYNKFHDFEAIYHYLLGYKNYISNSKINLFSLERGILIEGKPYTLMYIMNRFGFYEFKRRVFLDIGADHVIFRDNGLLIFEFKPDKDHKQGYYVFYTPKDIELMERHTENENLYRYQYKALPEKNWYYATIQENF